LAPLLPLEQHALVASIHLVVLRKLLPRGRELEGLRHSRLELALLPLQPVLELLLQVEEVGHRPRLPWVEGERVSVLHGHALYLLVLVQLEIVGEVLRNVPLLQLLEVHRPLGDILLRPSLLDPKHLLVQNSRAVPRRGLRDELRRLLISEVAVRLLDRLVLEAIAAEFVGFALDRAELHFLVLAALLLSLLLLGPSEII